MMNTRFEVVITFDEFINEIKTSILSFFPDDFLIKLTMIAMALVVGYGINRILTDNPKVK